MKIKMNDTYRYNKSAVIYLTNFVQKKKLKKKEKKFFVFARYLLYICDSKFSFKVL